MASGDSPQPKLTAEAVGPVSPPFPAPRSARSCGRKVGRCLTPANRGNGVGLRGGGGGGGACPWDDDDETCGWAGITCNGDGRVTEVYGLVVAPVCETEWGRSGATGGCTRTNSCPPLRGCLLSTVAVSCASTGIFTATATV